MNIPYPDGYQVYLTQNGVYEEKDSESLVFSSYPHPAELTFRFNRSFKNARRIRFDLGNQASHHIVTHVAFGFHILNLIKIDLVQWPLQDFASLVRPLHSIDQIRFEANQLHVIASGGDPHFEIPFGCFQFQKAVPLITSLKIKLTMLIILWICALGIYHINVIWRRICRIWTFSQNRSIIPSGFFSVGLWLMRHTRQRCH